MIAIVTARGDADEPCRQLMQAAATRGGAEYVDPLSLTVDLNDGPLLLAGKDSANRFDAFLLRGLNHQGEVDLQFEVFELLEASGMPVINGCRALSLAESKSATLFLLRGAGLPIPRTVACQTEEQAVQALRTFQHAVIKPLYGALGEGVERAEWPASRDRLEECLAQWRALCIQEYIPSGGRDIRAFIIGGRVVGAVMRIAQGSEWRTNVHQGGVCREYHLTPYEQEMCLRAAAIIGLEYTGIDVLQGPEGPVLLEVNGAPQWGGLVSATGLDVAGALVDRALELARRRADAPFPPR